MDAAETARRVAALRLYRESVVGREAQARFLLLNRGMRLSLCCFAFSATTTLLFALYAYTDYEVGLFRPALTDFHRSRFG